MKKSLWIVFLVGCTNISVGLSQANSSLSIGMDPFVISVLNGFEVELGYNFGKNRVAFEYLNAELPPVYNPQIDDFETVSTSVFELGFSRFLNEQQKGFHFGLAYSLFSDFTVETASGQSLSKDISKIGVRLGYMWFPFRKVDFFVEPLFNFGVYLDDQDLDFGNDVVFNQRTFAGSGPVIHLGYTFRFE